MSEYGVRKSLLILCDLFLKRFDEWDDCLMKYHYFLIIYFIFLFTIVSCAKNEESATIEKNLSQSISETIIDEPIDLSIKNILI